MQSSGLQIGIVLWGALALACARPITPEAPQLVGEKFPLIVDGKTSKEEILSRLGKPSNRYETGRIITYEMCDDFHQPGRLRQENTRIRCGLSRYSLILVFGPSDLVERHSLVSHEFNRHVRHEVPEVRRLTAEELKTETPIYDQTKLKGITYEVVQVIEATSCKHLPWASPPTEQEAIDQLRLTAHSLHANGIINMRCFGKAGVTNNCWGSITCNAVAIQVSP